MVETSMNCPQCGGSSRRPIAPGYWECTSTSTAVVPTGLHPSGIHGPTERYVEVGCAHRYQDGRDEASSHAPVCECGTYAIGECAECDIPVCGDCSGLWGPRRLCSLCFEEQRSEQVAAESQRLAAQAEAKAAVESAEAQKHAALVSARVARAGGSAAIAEAAERLSRTRDRHPYFDEPRLGLWFFIGLVIGAVPGTLAVAALGPDWVGWVVMLATGVAFPIIAGTLYDRRLRLRSRLYEEELNIREQATCGVTGCVRCPSPRLHMT